MTASEQLALAHERMTPDDIRAHALAMASVIESNHELITCLLDVLANYEKRIDASDQTRINTQIALRQIAQENRSTGGSSDIHLHDAVRDHREV